MKTVVERSDDKLTIQTVIQRSHWKDEAFRSMATHYHAVRAAQALESATEAGYKHISNETIGKDYQDAVLAQYREVLIYTIFNIKHKRDI